MPRLENWWTDMEQGDGFTPPEALGRILVGTVTGHHRKKDGELIKTTRMIKAEGRRVLTASGTVYELGEPRAEFVKWLAETGQPFDPENPVRMVARFSDVPRHEFK